MRIAIIFLGACLCLGSCVQQSNLSKKLFIGTWEGKYNDESIRLSFEKNDSLNIWFVNRNHHVIEAYKLKDNKLILTKGKSDTAIVQTINESDLVMRPVRKLQGDVDIIFLISFKRMD